MYQHISWINCYSTTILILSHLYFISNLFSTIRSEKKYSSQIHSSEHEVISSIDKNTIKNLTTHWDYKIVGNWQYDFYHNFTNIFIDYLNCAVCWMIHIPQWGIVIICYSFLIDVKASNHVNRLASFMIACNKAGALKL